MKDSTGIGTHGNAPEPGRSFKQFYPLSRLNANLTRSEAFVKRPKFPSEPSPRHMRFLACAESFTTNYIRLHRLLDSIARHLGVDYGRVGHKKNAGEHHIVRNPIELGTDVMMFFITMKILLDDIAFFTPFYYATPIKWKKGEKDLRDMEWVWSIRDMEKWFFEHREFDEEVTRLLDEHKEWIDEVSRVRKLLVHSFHDLSIHQDFWTGACYGFLWGLNTKKDFIPNVLTYVAKSYHSFVHFAKEYEAFFKDKCESQFQGFGYSLAGLATSGMPNRTHLFWGGLGRLIDGQMLLRIHSNRRTKVEPLLSKLLRDNGVGCSVCNKYHVKIEPRRDEFVRISVECNCGKTLDIPIAAEKRFYHYFMDQTDRHALSRLIPYTLD